jgi:myo-inositol 2-dehydrogenase/D-chiro-inositol 1-dehydrogenase
MPPVKLGFIGLGHIAQKTHLPALAPLLETGEVALQAFCDVDEATARQAAGEYGVAAVYTDHRAMLEREPLDAVFILIPPTLHTDAEFIAAERGIAMLIEKPPTLDMRQAVQYEAAIRHSGVVSQVGFMTRYYSAADLARLMLEERTPRHANVRRFYSGAPIRYWTSRMELCGGSFVENTIHTIDLLRYLYGDIDQVSAFYLDRKPGEEVGPMNLPHVYTVNYRFASGVVANATTSRCLTNAGVSRMDMTLVSDDSLIDWSPQRITENGAVIWEQAQPENPFALQAAAFARAVRERNPAAVRSPYTDALNSLAAVLAANESAARGGELINVKEFKGAPV